MDIKDDTRKRTLLLYAAGNEVEKIFATLSEVGEDKDYKKAVEKLNEYFLPKKNVLLETHKFHQLKQITEETIDQYCTRLRQQAIICEFSNSENELKIQLVEACLSSRVRRKAIQDDLSLANTLACARSLEITDKAVKTLEEDCGHVAPSSSAVNAIHNQQEKPSQYHERTNKQPHQSATQYPTRNRYSYQLKNAGRENSHEQQQNGKKLNYVIIVGKNIMQVILVCAEQRENLVLHVENKIISRLCAVVVKGTIFQTKGRTFKPLIVLKSNQIPLMKIHMFLSLPHQWKMRFPQIHEQLKPFQLLLKGLMLK